MASAYNESKVKDAFGDNAILSAMMFIFSGLMLNFNGSVIPYQFGVGLLMCWSSICAIWGIRRRSKTLVSLIDITLLRSSGVGCIFIALLINIVLDKYQTTPGLFYL